MLFCFRTAAPDCRQDAGIPGSCTPRVVRTALRSPHARKRHQLWRRPGPCVESGARPVRRVRREHQCGRALTEHARAEEECLACTIERDLCATGNFHAGNFLAGNFHAEGCFACTGEQDLCTTSLASVRRHGLTPGKRSRWWAFEQSPPIEMSPRACGATRNIVNIHRPDCSRESLQVADGVGSGFDVLSNLSAPQQQPQRVSASRKF